MDIHERQSFAPAERWRGFQFSTLVVCALGIFGNLSSLIVLIRHLNQIAGSRLLLGLAVADLGVAVSIASRTLSYVSYGNCTLTRVLDWWFLYCYYCSIYLTVLLSVDRYLHTAKPFLLLRINYHSILERVILAVFVVMLVASFPHLLGNFIHYYHGSHTARADRCFSRKFCNSSSIPRAYGGVLCSQDRYPFLLETEKRIYHRLKEALCDLAEEHNWDPDNENCPGHPVYVAADKYQPAAAVLFYHGSNGFWMSFCYVATSAMKYDVDFVKAVYLGIDLPLRFVIPCLVLVVLNIVLVRTVHKQHRHHCEISGTRAKSLLDLPALRSALGIVFVFLICHTGGAGLFILDVFRALMVDHKNGVVGTTVNVFLEEYLATMGLEMKYSALLLAAVNSSVNVALYCFFLPAFRQHWKSLFFPWVACVSAKSKQPIPEIVPLEELNLTPETIQKSLTENRTTHPAHTNEIFDIPPLVKRSAITGAKVLLRLFAIGILLILVVIVGYHTVWQDKKKMIDPAALRPVRHAKLLRHKNHGICVSQQWLVAVDWDSNITVYSLPELQLRSWKQVSCYWHPCADSFGVIYLPYIGFVTMVEVSDNGNLTVLGKLNVGGRFKQKKRLISVAVGSQPGQLYMAGRFSSNFYLVNTTSDTIIHNLTLPNEITDVVAIAALNSGQILVATAYGRLALYPSVFEPAELLTNVPFYYAWVSANANANQFLVSAWGMSMLFVLDRNGSWDAVKALNGVDGVWVPSIEDVAVWEDCVWVADLTGSLILLCPL